LGNVHANSNLIVADSSHGLLLGAILERTRGFGTILALCDGDLPNFDVLNQMNFPQSVLDSITFLPWSRLNSVESKHSIFLICFHFIKRFHTSTSNHQ
jgi:hypothetical protein